MSAQISVLGAGGMLGSALRRRLGVYGAYIDRDDIFEISEGRGLEDAAGALLVLSSLKDRGCELVINAIGDVQTRLLPEPTPLDHAREILANAVIPAQVAQAAAALGMRVLHVSTDCVFRGALDAPLRYFATAEPDAGDPYGLSKRLGEQDRKHVLNVRTSFIGPQHGLLRWFLEQPTEATLPGYQGHEWSGSTCEEVALHLQNLAYGFMDDEIESGVHHLATAEPISKNHVLNILKTTFRPDLEIVRYSEPYLNRALVPSGLPMSPLSVVIGRDALAWSQEGLV
jgi:dTDP-4-dehydrorhamnose reductase